MPCECLSEDDWHRLDDGCGDLPIMLGHDHDPQWLDTATAPSEIGSIFGCHHPGRLLVLQALHQDIRPSLAQYIQHFTPLDILVRYQHHCRAITACHAGESDITPSPAATRHPVPNVAQPTPQPSYSVRQASR
jgi:hypothetical protein